MDNIKDIRRFDRVTEITDGRSGVKKKKKMVNESEDSGEGGERTDDDWCEIKDDQKWV